MLFRGGSVVVGNNETNGGGEGGAVGAAQAVEVLGQFGEWGCCITKGRYGHFLANPNDIFVGRALLLYGEYSQGEADLFSRFVKPGHVVVEVGANVGALTVPLARMVGPEGSVFALEPQRNIYYLLCANLALNGLDQVVALHLAAGSKGGAQINVPRLDLRREQNFGALSLAGGQAVELGVCDQVTLSAIDDWSLGALDFLKVDVEGMEAEVLAGAKAAIALRKPVLYVEADREDKNSSLLGFVETMGYKAWWHFPPLFNLHNYANQPRNIYGDTVSINLLCLPAERAEEGEAALPGHAVASVSETWSVAHKRISEIAR